MIEFSSVPGGYALAGTIDYENAGAVMAEAAARIDAAPSEIALDLCGVESSVGSVVVALMLAWIRHAANADVSLRFEAVPSSVRRIIEFSGLLETVPMADTGAAEKG